MDASDCRSCQPGQDVNPLLFIFFCPHCVLSGIFALGATGVVTLPTLFGLAPEAWLAPALILGTFLGWLAWGAWSRRQPRPSGGGSAQANPVE